MKPVVVSRREVLTGLAAGAIMPSAAFASSGAANRKRVRRIAHLTDMHVQPERGAQSGFEACIAHALKQKPDFIMTGGDLIMDALHQDADRVKAQWSIFQAALKQYPKVRFEHCIGNHDVWGWGDHAKYKDESKYGKTWALEVLELAKPYRSFDDAGWHFVVLDSTHRTSGNGYTARLDDEQFEWLKDDLSRVSPKTPVMILSHIPILAVCCFFDGENEKTGNWVIPGAWVHIDARRIKDLFKKHPNVKICVSGHEHLLDQVVYNNVNYFCNGAVSAGWWGGDYYECTYGYSIVDLFDDGSFENKYVPFGWKTRD